MSSTTSMSTTSSAAVTSTVRSNLGPLTTNTWTPPSQCTYFGPGNNNASINSFYLAQSCLDGAPHDATACWPPATTTVADPPVLFGYGFYSPGLVCPPGYTQACAQAPPLGDLSGSVTKLQTFSFQYDQIDGETAIGCCPTGMTCSVGEGIQTCAMAASASSVKIGLCSDQSSKYASISSISVGSSASYFYGPLIQLVYQASDESRLFTPTTLTMSPVTGSASASTSSAAPTAVPTQDNSSGGLSNGAKIGIGVGLPLGVLLLAGLTFFFLFRWRRRRQQSAPLDIPYSPVNPEKSFPLMHRQPTLSIKELVALHGASELDSNLGPVVHELSGTTSLR